MDAGNLNGKPKHEHLPVTLHAQNPALRDRREASPRGRASSSDEMNLLMLCAREKLSGFPPHAFAGEALRGNDDWGGPFFMATAISPDLPHYEVL